MRGQGQRLSATKFSENCRTVRDNGFGLSELSLERSTEKRQLIRKNGFSRYRERRMYVRPEWILSIGVVPRRFAFVSFYMENEGFFVFRT